MQTQMDGGSVMDKFTASNGVDITIRPERDETYLLGKGGRIEGGTRHWTVATANMDGINALREFFQAERDEELGRWRWPESPEWVVYFNPNNTIRAVFNERTADYGDGLARWEIDLLLPSENGDVLASAAFFEAHPERKPWEDAKHGEVWLIAIDGEAELPMVVDRETTSFPRFVEPIGAMSYGPRAGITAARRIWPEVS